jgi:hypothetical protein
MGHLLKLKYAHSSVLSAYFIFNKCPPIETHEGKNLAVNEKKRITVFMAFAAKNDLCGKVY